MNQLKARRLPPIVLTVVGEALEKDAAAQDSLQKTNESGKPPIRKPETRTPATTRVANASTPSGLQQSRSPVTPRRDSTTTTKVLLPIERYLDTVPDMSTWLGSLQQLEVKRFVTKGKSAARGILSQAESAVASLDRTKENKVKHIYEMHTKYSMAVVCIIFVFIGAPLGAIVRKGGFGYPLLVSVVAFIVFVVLTIFCRKIAETFIVPAAAAAWLPCIILFPIGLWLTVKAMNDSKLFDMDSIGTIICKWRNRKQKEHVPNPSI